MTTMLNGNGATARWALGLVVAIALGVVSTLWAITQSDASSARDLANKNAGRIEVIDSRWAEITRRLDRIEAKVDELAK